MLLEHTAVREQSLSVLLFSAVSVFCSSLLVCFVPRSLRACLSVCLLSVSFFHLCSSAFVCATILSVS